MRVFTALRQFTAVFSLGQPDRARTAAGRFFRVLGLLLIVADNSPAAAPPNDICATAEVIPGSGPFPYFSALLPDVSGAGNNGDTVVPACVVGSATHSVWYQFTPTFSGLYSFSVSGDTETTVPDTVLAIYSSPWFCAGPFNLVGCNDDSGGLRSALSTILSGTSNYFVVVWVSAASAPLTNGNSAIQLKVSRPAVPANDVCAGAEVIPGAGPFPWLTTVVDTTLASTDSDPAPPACQPNSVRGVWFHFKPQYTTTYTLSTCAETETTVYNTSIALYSSVSGCQGPFQLAACNDSSCGPRAAITTSLTAGVNYYLLVWESGNDPYTPGETSVQVRVTGLFAPGVVTLPASSISSTGAVMHASVNPNGALTTAWFEWGSSTNALAATAPQILAAGSTISPFAANLASPGSGRTWFFRARATNILGSSVGEILSYLRDTNRPTLEASISEDQVSTIRFTGNPGQSYLILGSLDLQSWSDLGSALHEGNGSFSFSELYHAAGGKRFYRVLSP